MVVERVIDEHWYRARVTMVNVEVEELSLHYLDDGNTEEGVSFDDVRLVEQSPVTPLGGASAYNSNVPVVANPTLKKPLAGLVEDDWQERQNHVTTAVVHANQAQDTEEAIVLNGAENELAAGGGLRALRFIRKSSI